MDTNITIGDATDEQLRIELERRVVLRQERIKELTRQEQEDGNRLAASLEVAVRAWAVIKNNVTLIIFTDEQQARNEAERLYRWKCRKDWGRVNNWDMDKFPEPALAWKGDAADIITLYADDGTGAESKTIYVVRCVEIMNMRKAH